MPGLIDTLQDRPLLADGGIGSYIFELTGRLDSPSHPYEALNLENPDLIRGVHTAYLQAGARCITTNTFAANRIALRHAGLSAADVNRAGVHCARAAIDDFRTRTGDSGPFFIFGSVGPLPADGQMQSAAQDVFAEQIGALASAGADAILLETFPSLAEALPALAAASETPDCPPVVLHVSLQRWHGPRPTAADIASYVRQAAAAGARVIGVNCCAPWEAEVFAEAASEIDEVRSGDVLLSAMPNAGGFERIGHRFLSRVNPEFMGKLARTLLGRNVRLIGGCCEVHPPHIAEMHNYLQPASAGQGASHIPVTGGRAPASAAEKRENGRFSRKLFSGQFAVSVELLPPRGTGPRVIAEKVEFARALAASGLADAIDITDGSRGIPLMPPGDFIAVLREQLGWTPASGDALELIPHFTARDLNAMGLQSRLIGYHARRINNVLFVTGDPPKMSPTYPRSSAVFDLDSVSMVRYANSCLNSGVDFGGQPLGRQPDPRTRFTIGAGFEPEALNIAGELEKLERKIAAGVDYIFTQPVFRPESLDCLSQLRRRVPVFAGVLLLSSLDHARRFAEVPGVKVPQSVFDRLSVAAGPSAGTREPQHFTPAAADNNRTSSAGSAAVDSTAAAQARAGIDLAVEQVRWARREGWAGVYLMSPANPGGTIEVLRQALS
jgi:homocysteine S-methyltransferase